MKIEEEIEEAKKLFSWDKFIEYAYDDKHKLTHVNIQLLDSYLTKIHTYKRKNLLRREQSTQYR